jgi:hypothetical protein
VETGTEKSSRRTAPSRAEPQVNVLQSSVPAHRHPPGPGHEWAFWSFAEATDPINQTTPSPPLVRCFWREVPTPEREREEGGRGPLLPRRSCYSVSFVLPPSTSLVCLLSLPLVRFLLDILWAVFGEARARVGFSRLIN